MSDGRNFKIFIISMISLLGAMFLNAQHKIYSKNNTMPAPVDTKDCCFDGVSLTGMVKEACFISAIICTLAH